MHLTSILSKKLARFKVENNGWAKSLCPFHTDSRPSFFVNLHSGYAHCFGCGVRMGLQELLDKLNVHTFKAEHFIKQWGAQRKEVPNPNEVNYLPSYILGAYRACPVRLLNAGFEKQLLREFEVGFDYSLYRITFPIRDISGQLAAVSGRNLQGEPKYQVYTYEDEFPEYAPKPKRHLYNLYRLIKGLEQPDRRRPLYVVEGFKACLWVAQHGYDVVATMGAQMTDAQRALLSRYDVPLVLFLDNDEAGRAATVVNYLELSKLQFAKVVEYPQGAMQPDDLKGDDLHKTLENPKEFRRWYYELPQSTKEVRRSTARRS